MTRLEPRLRRCLTAGAALTAATLLSVSSADADCPYGYYYSYNYGCIPDSPPHTLKVSRNWRQLLPRSILRCQKSSVKAQMRFSDIAQPQGRMHTAS